MFALSRDRVRIFLLSKLRGHAAKEKSGMTPSLKTDLVEAVKWVK